MEIQVADFNGADAVFKGSHADSWAEVADALGALRLHLKESDQSNKVGAPIWDAVGNNAAISTELVASGWEATVVIGSPFEFLGKHVDFVKAGVVLEVQFSNYPFLLNNLLRCELFYKGRLELAGSPVEAGIIVAKAKMFDASNSTLHYEQAVSQVSALIDYDLFSVPIRLVGLFESYAPTVPVVWTRYGSRRYSRTIAERRETTAAISTGTTLASRARIVID
ncbi:MAG TPA: BglII/BstYI family type II restriction endonuclease [Solirubrobacteraceae bacterium]|jgi:hypothetical protein|nr:BglII/BstYI family type II restriction endonuclease [Solirubrobacteraceae bacterium]